MYSKETNSSHSEQFYIDFFLVPQFLSETCNKYIKARMHQLVNRLVTLNVSIGFESESDVISKEVVSA